MQVSLMGRGTLIYCMYYCTMGGLKFVKSAHTHKISDAMSASDKGMTFEIIR